MISEMSGAGRDGPPPNVLSCPVLLDYVEGGTDTRRTDGLSRDSPAVPLCAISIMGAIRAVT